MIEDIIGFLCAATCILSAVALAGLAILYATRK